MLNAPHKNCQNRVFASDKPLFLQFWFEWSLFRFASCSTFSSSARHAAKIMSSHTPALKWTAASCYFAKTLIATSIPHSHHSFSPTSNANWLHTIYTIAMKLYKRFTSAKAFFPGTYWCKITIQYHTQRSNRRCEIFTQTMAKNSVGMRITAPPKVRQHLHVVTSFQPQHENRQFQEGLATQTGTTTPQLSVCKQLYNIAVRRAAWQ